MAASLVAIAFVTVVYRTLLPVNPTTVALTYLAVVLLIASGWGIAEATTASLVAMVCFNFFFLPPLGTLTIADPQNWVALLAFLLTAVVTSQLSGRARQRHVEALARQRDLERLYALSRAMLLAERQTSVPVSIARHIAEAFAVPTVVIYDQRSDRTSWAGADEGPDVEARLREVARTAAALRGPSGLVLTAIRLGGMPIGSIAVTDVGLSDTVLQSIANLAAIGLEQARATEATARAEAARESSELRATVLDALAHEFKTPLTSMKAASGDLRGSVADSPRDRELVAIIEEDLDRFQSLVSDAVQMLRIDAGDFTVHLARHPIGVLIEAVVEKFGARLDGHRVVRNVPDDLTVDADRELLTLALRQLIDNALKYSPPSSTIEIRARANGSVDIAIRNSGSTISEVEQGRVFDRFYRGAEARQMPGTGMGLAIVRQIARAHGGTATVASAPETGTEFSLCLPRGGTPA
jgi:two-component system sensor histidine kinase KdpD